MYSLTAPLMTSTSSFSTLMQLLEFWKVQLQRWLCVCKVEPVAKTGKLAN